MCQLCKEMKKGNMTSEEILRAVGEMMQVGKQTKHLSSIVDKVMSKEIPYKERDLELEKLAVEEGSFTGDESYGPV